MMKAKSYICANLKRKHNDCSGFPYPFQNENIKDAHAILSACRSLRTAPRTDLDQCPSTIETTIKRLALLSKNETLKDKKILLLGDDDLLSLALSTSTEPSIITVLDLDEGLLTRIKQFFFHGHPDLRVHDLRLGLPADLYGQYDLVFTDPPYTIAGQMLFLKAAVNAIRCIDVSSIYLCASRLYLSDSDIAIITSSAKNAGLHLLHEYADFNEYESPQDAVTRIEQLSSWKDSSHFTSSILHFKPAQGVLNPENLPFLPTEIYNYEENYVAC